MKKLKEHFGRGYLLGYLAVTTTFLLAVVALWQHPNQYQFILSFWTDFLMYFVVPLVGAKEVGKIGTAFAGRRNGRALKAKPEGETSAG